jgi:protein subunit release factor B
LLISSCAGAGGVEAADLRNPMYTRSVTLAQIKIARMTVSCSET